MIVKLEAFPVTGNVKALMTLIVDHYMQELKNRRPEIVISIFRIFIKNAKNPELLHTHFNAIVPPLAQCLKKNQSGTIRVFNDDELKLYVIAGVSMIRNSYMEQDQYFGTEQHRLATINALTKLFSA